MYAYEQAAYQQGIASVCGVDEAGRGPLAGDVYAAAVILPQGLRIEGIDDSKKLSEKKREKLYDEITAAALYYCIATATVEEIDRLNILQASMLAMRRAVAGLSLQPALVLVDGNCDPKFPKGICCKTIVGGDGTSASIAAASILAKVARDRYMRELDVQYPAYRFAQHKGYGTKLHYEMLKEHGISPVHRRTFLKKLQPQEDADGTDA
ncbi:MAG: ribonuclease HII [Anaerotruncus sp.]|jgi:ribonuclease HII|nr:ribonuclease HII [Anaerotruncus sp.]